MGESIEKKFFKFGQERKKLRNDVLDESGVSANEIIKRGAVSDTDFMAQVKEENIVDVADKAVVAKDKEAGISEKIL